MESASRLEVRVGPSHAGGELTPYTSGGTLMLGDPMQVGTPSPFGVNVGSSLILDALDDGTVSSVEVLARRPAWRRSKDASPRPPASITSGTVVLANLVPDTYVEKPVTFKLADPEPGDFEQLSPRFSPETHRRLHIEIEPASEDTRWLALSTECFALLNGVFLAGFVALLPR